MSGTISQLKNQFLSRLQSIKGGVRSPSSLSQTSEYTKQVFQSQANSKLYSRKSINLNLQVNEEQQTKEQGEKSSTNTKQIQYHLLEEAFNIIIIQKLLQYQNPIFNNKIILWQEQQQNSYQNQNEYLANQKIYQYYEKNVISIEIINQNNELQKVIFRKPILAQYLSQWTMLNFLEQAKRGSPNEKLNELLNEIPAFFKETLYFSKLSSLGLRFSLTYFQFVRYINLIIAITINIILLAEKRNNWDDYHKELPKGVNVLAILQLTTQFIIMIFFLIFQAPLD